MPFPVLSSIFEMRKNNSSLEMAYTETSRAGRTWYESVPGLWELRGQN